MKRLFTLALFALLCAGSAKAQRLLIRGDDIGGSHASNVGIITTFTEGIERTAEVMVVGPWFPEAVELLRANEGLDVGVHIVLTSEWDGYKWRPMTECPSLSARSVFWQPSHRWRKARPICTSTTPQ